MKKPGPLPVALVLASAVTVLFVPGCANESKLQQPEDQFRTGGDDLSIFHRIAERDQGLGLRFPGFIVGIEKSPRDRIGAGKCSLWRGGGQAFDNLDPGAFPNNNYYRDVQSSLNDCKRMFVSSITEYRLNDATGLPYMEEVIHYSAYDKKYNSPDAYGQAYGRGQNELTAALGARLKAVVANAQSGQPYTHILFYSMGWNTDQQESLRNYNSLVMQLAQTSTGQKFKPLFIGITWPSEWSWRAFEGLGRS